MTDPAARALLAARRAQNPHFLHAVLEDAKLTAAYRGEPGAGSRAAGVVLAMRLAWQSDAFAAQVLYRGKARLQALGVPIVPRLLHRLAMLLAQVCIGDPVVVAPGLYLAHGQVVIDGLTEIGSGCVILPFVTIGLKAGNFAGPTVGNEVSIGTGAKVIGPVHLGDGCRVGANAVVVRDVPAGVTVAGIPATPLPTAETAPHGEADQG